MATTIKPVISMGELNRRVSQQLDLGSALQYQRNLTPFQVEKFTYMFNALFDLDKNLLIEKQDMSALADKMRKYAGWSTSDGVYKGIVDVQMVFLECLQDQVKKEKAANAASEVIGSWEEALKNIDVDASSISLSQWLNMWGQLTYGCAGLSDFPCWVQMLPGIFFRVIDLDNDGVLSMDEYRKFYRDFVGIPDSELDRVTKEGFRAMTAGGDYKLTEENFKFCFANFLLGRSIYGPGKYIFGVFDNRDIDERFQVNYNQEDEE